MDNKKDNKRLTETIRQIVRFNIVGIFNTAFTYGVYAALVFAGVRDLIALCIEYPIGICVSYFLNHKITFKGSNGSIGAFLRMVSIYIPALVVNEGLLWYFTTYVGLNSYIAQFISLAIVTIASFLLQKNYVFKIREKE